MRARGNYATVDNIATDVKAKDSSSLVGNMAGQGTKPHQLTDLIGSLCDLTSGLDYKDTPVVLVKGYFDNYIKTI